MSYERFRGRRVRVHFKSALIVTIISLIAAVISTIFDEPLYITVSALLFLVGSITTMALYFTDTSPSIPRGNKSKAYIYSSIVTIVFIGIYLLLENVLEFDDVIEYWISGFFALIGFTSLFVSVGLIIDKFKNSIGVS